MDKRTEFSRDTIEVCRNCKSEGTVTTEMFNGSCNATIPCPVCGGSGFVRKHIEGFVSIEPYTKSGKA